MKPVHKQLPHSLRLWWCMASFLASTAFAERPGVDGFGIVPLGNRDVVVLPESTARIDAELEFGSLEVRSFETSRERIHILVFEGETYRASTPLEGEFSRIVFDPARREFVPLLSNIRVEIDEFTQLESIAEALAATGVTPFQSLGFAIIHLPETVHPVEAVSRLKALPNAPEAFIRVRGPRISWR